MTLPMTFQGHFKYYKRLHCLCLKNTAYIRHEVDYNGRTYYVGNYFSVIYDWKECCITLSATC